MISVAFCCRLAEVILLCCCFYSLVSIATGSIPTSLTDLCISGHHPRFCFGAFFNFVCFFFSVLFLVCATFLMLQKEKIFREKLFMDRHGAAIKFKCRWQMLSTGTLHQPAQTGTKRICFVPLMKCKSCEQH